MATAKKPGGTKRKSKPRDPEKKVIDAAMKLATEKGWANLSLAEIGEAAGLDFKDLFAVAPSKSAILEALSRRVDAEVLSEGPLDAGDGSARDRLFDVLMRRFDALLPYREGLGEVIYDLRRHPLEALMEGPGPRRSLAWMLEAAGIDSSGIKGLLRVKALSAIYLMSLRVWLKDDTADLSKTMAALDGYLRRLEPWAERFEGAGSRHAPSSDDETAKDVS
jgi:AcrR family transcriptional regulator